MSEPVSLADMLADTSQPPPAIIGRGILPERSLLLLCGPPKVGKSFLVMNFAGAIASGLPFGIFTSSTPQRVLLLSAELGYYPLRDRLNKMMRRVPRLDASRIRAIGAKGLNLNSEADMRTIERWIEEFRPKVVVIDPLVRFHDGEENNARDMSKVFGRLRGLIETYGISILLVHHTGKDASRGARGSSTIMGEYDTAIYVSRTHGTLKMTFEMRHGEPPEGIEMTFNSNTFWFEPADEIPVLRVLREADDERTRAEIADECVRRNLCARATAYRQIDTARGAGAIREVREGVYVYVN